MVLTLHMTPMLATMGMDMAMWIPMLPMELKAMGCLMACHSLCLALKLKGEVLTKQKCLWLGIQVQWLIASELPACDMIPSRRSL